MTAQEHGNIFEEGGDLNLDRFKPKSAPADNRPTPQDLRGIAERTKFVSREAKDAKAPSPSVPLLRRGAPPHRPHGHDHPEDHAAAFQPLLRGR